MKMKKKLYGILAFVLVALCALGFALGFTACSNKEKEDDKDPIIGVWSGEVAFTAYMGSFPLSLTADTTITVNDDTFSLTVTLSYFDLEDYPAITDAPWYKDDTTGIYHATATIEGIDNDVPIELIEIGEGLYEMSLTTNISFSFSGLAIDAVFEDARVRKEGVDYSEDKLFPVGGNDEEEMEESSCGCGENCTCEENCVCGETCECGNCGSTSGEDGCTCGEECTCAENCDCGEECTCDSCKQGEDE